MKKIEWNTIITRLREKKVTPIVSQRISEQILLGTNNLLQSWAEEVGYPFSHRLSKMRIAQYIAVHLGESLAARQQYVEYIKRYLLQEAQKGDKLRTPNGDSTKLSIAELATDLGIPDLSNPSKNPLRILAEFELPIYLTTAYDNLLELTLKQAKKTPRTETSNWNLNTSNIPTLPQTNLGSLRDLISKSFNLSELGTLTMDLGIPLDNISGSTREEKARELVSLFQRHQDLPRLIHVLREKRPQHPWDSVWGNILVQPMSEEQPLIYHLYGIETEPETMVLTEDDFFDFLVQVARERELLINEVHTALTENSLILLGYDLEDWEFKLLFHGIITKKKRQRRELNVCIQLDPERNKSGFVKSAEEAQDYFEQFFKTPHNFRIYWGDSLSFLQELSQRVE